MRLVPTECTVDGCCCGGKVHGPTQPKPPRKPRPAPFMAWLDLDALLVAAPAQGWERQGACFGSGDLDRFYPEGNDMAPAKRVCERCPVRVDCLAANLHDEHGVWGGTSARERRKIRSDLHKRGVA